MGSKFDISALLNNASKESAKGESFQITKIEYDNLIPNDKNKYKITDIEALANTIKAYGLAQNLVVTPAGGGKYTILTGHRRYAAIGLIRKENPDMFQYVPCKIETVNSNADERIKMIITNSTVREMTDAEKLEQFIDLEDAVNERIKEGVDVGNKREFLAKLLKVSQTQIQRYRSIRDSLIPELKEKINTNDLSVQEASKIAKLPSKQQENINKDLANKEKEDNKVETPETLNEDSSETYTIKRENIQPIIKSVNACKNLFIPVNKVFELSEKDKLYVDKKIVAAQKAIDAITKKLNKVQA